MLYKCQNCNYVNQGDKIPEYCSKCGSSKDSIIELSKEEEDKIYASDRTNDIYMDIIGLAMEIIYLCDEAIGINLDENCFNFFNETKDKMWILKQAAKSEIEGHVHKGKW